MYAILEKEKSQIPKIIFQLNHFREKINTIYEGWGGGGGG